MYIYEFMSIFSFLFLLSEFLSNQAKSSPLGSIGRPSLLCDLFLGHVLENIKKHSDFFSRLSCFHTIPKLSVYPETFKFVLETFQNKVLSENNV